MPEPVAQEAPVAQPRPVSLETVVPVVPVVQLVMGVPRWIPGPPEPAVAAVTAVAAEPVVRLVTAAPMAAVAKAVTRVTVPTVWAVHPPKRATFEPEVAAQVATVVSPAEQVAQSARAELAVAPAPMAYRATAVKVVRAARPQ